MPFSSGAHRSLIRAGQGKASTARRDNYGHSSQTTVAADVNNFGMTPELLTRTVQDFLQEAAGAVVLEDGAVMFDLAQAKYSISGEHNKCLLHLVVGGAEHGAAGA